MQRRYAFLLILGCLFHAAIGRAETAKILTPKGIGVSSSVVETYAEVLRLAVTQAKLRVVSNPKAKADVTLRPTISKIGGGYLLVLEKRAKGAEPYEDSFKIASEDELDVGTKRLVNAVLKEQPASTEDTVDDVTKDEVTAGTARRQTVKRVLVAFGPAWGYGLGSSDLLYHVKTAYTWEGEHLAPRLFGDFNWAAGSSQMASAAAGLGLDYYLGAAKQAPFIGIDAGLGVLHRAHTAQTRADGHSMYYSGFSLGANVGYAIMRTSDVSMIIEASIRPVLGGIVGKAAGIYGFDIGILF